MYILSFTGLVVAASPSDIRPTNPTPGHATGQGTPTALRPTNPTPAHASQPHAPTRPSKWYSCGLLHVYYIWGEKKKKKITLRNDQPGPLFFVIH